MELIDKEKVVAEIERIRTYYEKLQMIKQVYNGYIDNCNDLLDFLDTLEVKEVDCEREIGIYTTKELLKKRNHSTGVFHLTQTDINSIAKHFFDFGLNVKKEE